MSTLKHLLQTPEVRDSCEIYPEDTLLHHHNQSSSQHMTENVNSTLTSLAPDLDDSSDDD